MAKQTRVIKEILAHLNGQKDSRATAEELIAIVAAAPADFCSALNALREQGLVRCAEFQEDFVRQGGDASFRMSVFLTAAGQEHYIDMVRREAGHA